MKAVLLLALAAAAVPVVGADSGGDSFSSIGVDYKKPRELADNFFNPFKGQAPGGELARKEAASVTNEAVAGAIEHRGVFGIVFAPDASADRVIVGDQVFGVGDELSFPEAADSGSAPLVAGALVILREVREDNLQFDVVPEGEASRRLIFSLRGFWRR